MEDLGRASLEDVQAFFHTYYTPSNATLVLAGQFDTAQAKDWILRYFGTLASKPKPIVSHAPTFPLAAPQRKVVSEPVEIAQVLTSWLAPPAYSDAEPALDLATTILGSGKSSRLYQRLVVKDQTATEVSAYIDPNALASEVTAYAQVASGKSVKDVETALGEEIERLGKAGPSAEELARAKRKHKLALMSTLQTLNGHGGEGGRAGLLQRANHYLGDPALLDAHVAKTYQVTASDVQRAVKAFMVDAPSATVITKPLPPDVPAKGAKKSTAGGAK
jgi:predicted Zn-dependent peptidase